jgi:hypothetical protein
VRGAQPASASLAQEVETATLDFAKLGSLNLIAMLFPRRIFPLDLMLALVSYFSNPGEIVFDPCGGSGATARGRSAVLVCCSSTVSVGTRSAGSPARPRWPSVCTRRSPPSTFPGSA